jgi:Skp family chaperone for outer membrane proteins
MRRALFAAPLLALLMGQPLLAQESGPFLSPVLTLNQQGLFENSEYGKASLARLEAATRDLQAENRRIEAGLEAEEKELTARRAALTMEAFRPLSAAFDDKVEGIRAAQDAKSRELTRQRDQDRQRFFEKALPILADLMRESGAVVLMDQSAIILSLDRIDVTDQAIARVDAAFVAEQSPAADPQQDEPVDGTPRGNP